MQCFLSGTLFVYHGKGGRMSETYQIEMNVEQLERLLKNLPEGIMLEICFGKEEHGEYT